MKKINVFVRRCFLKGYKFWLATSTEYDIHSAAYT